MPQDENLEVPPTDGTLENPDNTDPPIPVWHSVVYQSNQRAEVAEREARETRRLLEEERQQRNAPPPVVLQPGDPFNNPEEFRRVLRNDMEEMIRPIRDFTAGTSRMMQYNNIKNQMKNSSPGAAQAFANIELMLDQRFAQNTSLEISENSIMEQIKYIIGDLAVSGRLPMNQPNNPNPNPPPIPRPPVIPPSNRPSPPANIPPANRFDASHLDENARRLAREQKMTLQEFDMMQKADPNNVEEVWRDILKARKENRRYGA